MIYTHTAINWKWFLVHGFQCKTILAGKKPLQPAALVVCMQSLRNILGHGDWSIFLDKLTYSNQGDGTEYAHQKGLFPPRIFTYRRPWYVCAPKCLEQDGASSRQGGKSRRSLESKTFSFTIPYEAAWKKFSPRCHVHYSTLTTLSKKNRGLYFLIAELIFNLERLCDKSIRICQFLVTFLTNLKIQQFRKKSELL